MTPTAEQLREAEAAHRAAFRRYEETAQRRNQLVREALASGAWTQRQVAATLGVTPGRVGQIASRR